MPYLSKLFQKLIHNHSKTLDTVDQEILCNKIRLIFLARPIAIMPYLSEVFERLIHNHSKTFDTVIQEILCKKIRLIFLKHH